MVTPSVGGQPVSHASESSAARRGNQGTSPGEQPQPKRRAEAEAVAAKGRGRGGQRPAHPEALVTHTAALEIGPVKCPRRDSQGRYVPASLSSHYESLGSSGRKRRGHWSAAAGKAGPESLWGGGPGLQVKAAPLVPLAGLSPPLDL